jgi:hypothetical protein
MFGLTLAFMLTGGFSLVVTGFEVCWACVGVRRPLTVGASRCGLSLVTGDNGEMVALSTERLTLLVSMAGPNPLSGLSGFA